MSAADPASGVDVARLSTPRLAVVDHDDGTGAVRELALCRPERRNALDTQLARDLLVALEASGSDPAVRSIVVSGRGVSFCAGGDLHEFTEATSDESLLVRSALMATLFRALPSCPTPVIAAAHGAALGAGGILVLASDLAVAGSGLLLGFPEARQSLLPALVLPAVVDCVGRKMAFELLMIGRPLDAREAYALGLVNRVVDDTDVVIEAIKMARSITGLTRGELARTKRLFREAIGGPPGLVFDRGLSAEIEAQVTG